MGSNELNNNNRFFDIYNLNIYIVAVKKLVWDPRWSAVLWGRCKTLNQDVNQHLWLKIKPWCTALIYWASATILGWLQGKRSRAAHRTGLENNERDKNVPQGADEAVGGALRIQGADVPDVEETGHLVWHFSQVLDPPVRLKRERKKQQNFTLVHDSSGSCKFPLHGCLTIIQ